MIQVFPCIHFFIRVNGMKIATAGIGYVELSIVVLLLQYNFVKAVDIVPERCATTD